jgi:2-dehydro-3-deoxy-D-gluconate 5-dehydrogenase
MRRFVDKTVAVTGAGFGIGRGIALRFAQEGAKVAVLDLDGHRAAETVQTIHGEGGTARAIKTDVSAFREVKDAISEVNHNFGPVDVLVNNAGVRYIRAVLDVTEEEWQYTLAVNLNGVFYMVKEVAPLMLRRGGGKIVNVASVSGFLGQTGRSAYGATKGGIVQLTRSLAVELGPTVNVNAVAPGYIRGTGMMTQVDKDPKSAGWMIANTPVHRAGTPDDVAAAVAFLASEEASFITGATLPVDGGFMASKYMVEGQF